LLLDAPLPSPVVALVVVVAFTKRLARSNISFLVRVLEIFPASG